MSKRRYKPKTMLPTVAPPSREHAFIGKDGDRIWRTTQAVESALVLGVRDPYELLVTLLAAWGGWISAHQIGLVMFAAHSMKYLQPGGFTHLSDAWKEVHMYERVESRYGVSEYARGAEFAEVYQIRLKRGTSDAP